MFALFVPSCCDKSETSCYHLVTRLMTVTDLLQSCSNYRLFVTSCYEFVESYRSSRKSLDTFLFTKILPEHEDCKKNTLCTSHLESSTD